MFDLIKDPGEGNLNLRAIVASIVGPYRVAHGSRTVKQVARIGAAATQIAQNAGRNKEVVYIEAWLPTQLQALGVQFLFSSSDQTGENAKLVLLTATPGQLQNRYQAVLLVNEQLYGQAVSDGAGAALPGPTVPLVVSTVTF